jgi:glyoxylase-like metal-dependent hydrolase (beta-lactamase superfamily II)
MQPIIPYFSKLAFGLLLTTITACSYSDNNTQNLPQDLTVTRLNCGNILVKNLALFSVNHQYNGQSKEITSSCYLIKKADKLLLWDTGIPSIAKDKPIEDDSFKATLDKTLTEHLKDNGLTHNDITHVAVSHGHFDHSANIAEFPHATLIMQRAEYDFIMNNPKHAEKIFIYPNHFKYFTSGKGKIRLLDGDTDLFNDGTLQAISLTGHTPGHMALLIKLSNGKNYVLSGDQWHFDENYASNDLPIFNYDKKHTLESSDKLKKIIQENNATLIIQHEPKDAKQVF